MSAEPLNAAGQATADGDAPSRLRRGITPTLLFVFILGDVLGAGVYALTGELAADAGGMIWAPVLIALVLALLTAASYAELVTKYPKAGGAAVFTHRAFGRPVLSFLIGYCMLAAGVVSVAGLAVAFAGDYLATFVDLPGAVAAPLFLLLVAAVNARGIKESVRSNLVMTAIEVSGLVLVVVLVAVALGAGRGEPARVLEAPAEGGIAAGVFAAALIAFYSFVGFETSANVAEEVRGVRRVYPRALFGALLATGVIYLLVALASASMLPAEELAGSSGPLLAVVQATGVAVPAWLFSAIALIAVANGALLTSIMSSRLLYGMAEEALMPRVLTRVLPERRTPWVAIVVTTALSVVLSVFGTLELLAETVVLFLLVVFIAVNASVLALRNDEVGHRHFRTPRAIPVIALLSCLALLTQQVWQVWALGAVLLVLGGLVYALMRVLGRAEPQRS